MLGPWYCHTLVLPGIHTSRACACFHSFAHRSLVWGYKALVED